MPSVRPFKGIIYNRLKIKDQTNVVSPPYDVIPKELQETLYRRNPYNIVRLILGHAGPKDNIKNNRYKRAKNFFEDWLKKHILVRDEKNAVYIYSQIYIENKKTVERVGFIGLMELGIGNKRKALPHENTLLAPKLDRLNLIRSVRANLEPIFVLYEDTSHSVSKILKDIRSEEKPFIDIEADGVKHRVWRSDDLTYIKRIQRLMRPKVTFIADGHHRYEVSVQYSLEIQDEDLPDEVKTNSKYIMAYFVELNDEMLTILPTHRLIKDIGILKSEDILKRLSKFFDIRKERNLELLISKLYKLKASNAFGMYTGKANFYILKLSNPKIAARLIKNNSKDWKRLDVTILHLFLLEYVLGIRDGEDNIEFVKDAEKAANFVDKGKFKIAFFLNPTKVSQVKRIAKLGEKMPRKATYFYPKPLSGLVINKL